MEGERVLVQKTKEMTRADLHHLVDELPEGTIEAAARVLEVFREATPPPAPMSPRLAGALSREPDDPFLQALARAPLDDEPVTAADRGALEDARAEIDHGDVVTLDEVASVLGHTDEP